MVNTVLFCFNVLILIMLWHFMIKKTILDHHRDKLFDLRKEVRDHFISQNIPMDSAIYRSLLDLINGHLLFSEGVSFAQFVFMESAVKNNPPLKDHLKKQIDAKFNTDSKELNAYVLDVRCRAVSILKDYIISSSGITWVVVFFISLLFIPYMITKSIFTFIGQILSNGIEVFSSALLGVNFLFQEILSINTSVFGRAVKRDLLEEYSYRYSSSLRFAG